MDPAVLLQRPYREYQQRTNIIKRNSCSSIVSLTQTVYWSAKARYKATIRYTYQIANCTQRNWWNMLTLVRSMVE